MDSLKELNRNDLQKVQGGILSIAARLVVAGLASELIFDGPEQCWEDFKKGYESTQK